MDLVSYKAFIWEYRFIHVTSSPLYPKGNGEAEQAVKTVKHMLKKWGDPYVALLVYWATPLQNRFSPAELLMSCRLRTNIPATKIDLEPLAPDYQVVKERDRRQKSWQERNFNKCHRSRDLTCPEQGDCVWIPDRNSEGEVAVQVNPRSSQARTTDGIQEKQSCSPSSTPEIGGKYTLFPRTGPGRQPTRQSFWGNASTRAASDDSGTGNWNPSKIRAKQDSSRLARLQLELRLAWLIERKGDAVLGHLWLSIFCMRMRSGLRT